MFATRWIALQKYKKIDKTNKFLPYFSPQATSSVAQCAERIPPPATEDELHIEQRRNG